MRFERADYPPAHSSSHIACSWSVSALSLLLPLSLSLSLSRSRQCGSSLLCLWFHTIQSRPNFASERFYPAISESPFACLSFAEIQRTLLHLRPQSLAFASFPFPSHPIPPSTPPIFLSPSLSLPPSPSPRASTRKRKKETHLIKTCPKTPPSCPSGDFSSAPLN